MQTRVSLTVNGKPVDLDVDARTLLVELLRKHLGLTGTHIGCDTAQCGACTVHVDGRAVKSCSVLAAQMQDTNVTTIEGLAQVDGSLHPMQQAFINQHGLQCGFCTPGLVMSSIEFVKRYPDPDEHTVRDQLEGNICRCTGYQNIVKAIQEGARLMASANAPQQG